LLGFANFKKKRVLTSFIRFINGKNKIIRTVFAAGAGRTAWTFLGLVDGESETLC
jgi:hypothetical protein